MYLCVKLFSTHRHIDDILLRELVILFKEDVILFRGLLNPAGFRYNAWLGN